MSEMPPTGHNHHDENYEKSLLVKAGAHTLFAALTDPAGLAGWWTAAIGSGTAGGQLTFFFPDPLLMHVDEATRPSKVRWTVKVCDFLPDWVNTHPSFTITRLDNDVSELNFRHDGLTAELDCIEMCTRGWDHFLDSLRQYAETGRGNPHLGTADRARRALENGATEHRTRTAELED